MNVGAINLGCSYINVGDISATEFIAGYQSSKRFSCIISVFSASDIRFTECIGVDQSLDNRPCTASVIRTESLFDLSNQAWLLPVTWMSQFLADMNSSAQNFVSVQILLCVNSS